MKKIPVICRDVPLEHFLCSKGCWSLVFELQRRGCSSITSDESINSKTNMSNTEAFFPRTSSAQLFYCNK